MLTQQITVETLAEDISTYALGWANWSAEHEQLAAYIKETLRRFREDIYKDTEPTTLAVV